MARPVRYEGLKPPARYTSTAAPCTSSAIAPGRMASIAAAWAAIAVS